MEQEKKSIDTYLDEAETKLATTFIYERDSRLVPHIKTKSILLLSNNYLYIDEFNFFNKKEYRNIFKFNYVQAMENNYKYFEHIDRESDFITSGKSTIQFYFLNKYNTFVFSSLSPDGGITEITKAGSKFYKLYGDNETIIRKTFTVDTSFVEKLI